MIALTTAGHEPIAPASPAPFTPSGFVTHGTFEASDDLSPDQAPTS